MEKMIRIHVQIYTKKAFKSYKKKFNKKVKFNALKLKIIKPKFNHKKSKKLKKESTMFLKRN